MADYVETTQEIFINSEDGFGTNGGDQVNKFRLNFTQEPFEAQDEAILRINMTQFNLQKNFYDVNETNNTIRISNTTVAGAGDDLAMSLGDEFISIPSGDYKNQPDIVMACLAQSIVDYLNSKLTTVGGSFSFVLSAGTTASTNIDLVTERGANSGRNAGGGQVQPSCFTGAIPGTAPQGTFASPFFRVNKRKYALRIVLTLPGVGTGDLNNLNLVIQCLNVPKNVSQVITTGGVLATANQQFNDSYILFGGARIENNVPNPALSVNPEQSFSIQVDSTNTKELTIVNPFPVAQGCNTTPNLYLRCEEAGNQSSATLETAGVNHDHSIIPSRILAKIPRVTNTRHEISYTLENVAGIPFFTNVTSNYLNHLIFSITDQRGRPITPVSISDFPNSVQQQIRNGTTQALLINQDFLDDTKTQNFVGNLFCDFAFKVSKHKRKLQKKILQTQQPPIITNNRLEFSGVIPNSVYSN